MISSVPLSSSITKMFSSIVPSILSEGSCMSVCICSWICIFKIYIETQKGAENTEILIQVNYMYLILEITLCGLSRQEGWGQDAQEIFTSALDRCNRQAPFQGQAANGMISTKSTLCHTIMTLSRTQSLWIQEEASSHLLKAAEMMLQHEIFPGSRNSPHVVSQWEGNFTSPADSLPAPVQLSVALLFIGGIKQLQSNLDPSVLKVRMFWS